MQVLQNVLDIRMILSVFWLGAGGVLIAQSSVVTFEFQSPIVEQAVFGETLSMLTQERADYAKNLSCYAANHINEKEASADSLVLARRLLAVALHLSPRSKDALVVSHQLKQGVMPKLRKMDYSPEVFARLLLTRAQLLSKQNNEGEQFLSRAFIELAAMIDPRNEDAVYEFQIQMIDHGELDWGSITDAKNP